MKKLFVIIMTVIMAFSLTACSGKIANKETANKETEAVSEEVKITDALEILTTVWGTYEESDRFPVGGGDSANINWEGPAKFDTAMKEELDANYGISEELSGQIDDAATMMHAMMMNNFAAGAYHLTDAAKADSFAETLKTDLLTKNWLCGQPEKVMIVRIGDYMVAGYGLTEFLDTFKTKLTEAYDAAEVLYEEAIG